MPNLLLKEEKHITKSALFQFAPILFRRLLQPDRQLSPTAEFNNLTRPQGRVLSHVGRSLSQHVGAAAK
jgi:hypothetical protein